MTRRGPCNMPLTLILLAVTACEESTAPSQLGPSADDAPAALLSTTTSNTWLARAPMGGPDASPWAGLAAGVVKNSEGRTIVYVFGGHDDDIENGAISAYNPVTNSWKRMGPTFTGSYTNGVGEIAGKLYISGGYIRPGFCCDATQSSLYVYDPAANVLTRKADMPRPTAEGVTGTIMGKLYVLSGYCSDEFGPVFDCDDEATRRLLYRYDPATNTWTTLGPAPRFHVSGAAGVINGKLYVAGGGDGHFGPTANLDVYDPVTNTWKALAPMPTARRQAGGTVVNGKLYVVGIGGGNRNTYVYNPATNRWATKAPLPAPTYPWDAVRIMLRGLPRVLAIGGGSHPEGPAPSQLYTP